MARDSRARSFVAGAPRSGGDLDAVLQRFAELSGTKSCVVHVGPGGSLGWYLREVEAGWLYEDEQLAVDDGVRMLGSPAFLNLAGTTQARSVLDAMIAYGDNTATDIAQAHLSSVRTPSGASRVS